MPKGGEDDEEEEEERGNKKPEQQDGAGQEKEKESAPKGPRMELTQDEAAMLLNSFKLDGNRKLPMGERETTRPKDRPGKDY